MKQKPSRRDFLKLLSAISLVPLANKVHFSPFDNRSISSKKKHPNIIIFLFDALSARNISLYGYSRKTTPNLEKFAKKATVFHRHYSSSNFTTPSTASFFTSVYPWTHRSIHLYSPITEKIRPNNLFSHLSNNENYYRIALSNNLLADQILHQFSKDIDNLFPVGTLTDINHLYHDTLFKKDGTYSSKGLDVLSFRIRNSEDNLATSLVLSVLNEIIIAIRRELILKEIGGTYPLGIGHAHRMSYFTVDEIFNNLGTLLEDIDEFPFVSYFHFMFPHFPYVPSEKFLDKFINDGWKAIEKPLHILGSNESREKMVEERNKYDAYIANIDDEFGKFVTSLESMGLLENSYIIVTSDHGEMFERGHIGHGSPLLYEPIIHIPLIIKAPEQSVQEDIYSLTCTIDITPTLLHLTGNTIPDWCEGQILPSLGGKTDSNRAIYSMQARENSAFAPLEEASFAIYKNNYKLIEYIGYPTQRQPYEVYDILNDPEEMKDLSITNPSTVNELRTELYNKLNEVNKPFL